MKYRRFGQAGAFSQELVASLREHRCLRTPKKWSQ
jgi:hypothetical protein